MLSISLKIKAKSAQNKDLIFQLYVKLIQDGFVTFFLKLKSVFGTVACARFILAGAENEFRGAESRPKGAKKFSTPRNVLFQISGGAYSQVGHMTPLF